MSAPYDGRGGRLQPLVRPAEWRARKLFVVLLCLLLPATAAGYLRSPAADAAATMSSTGSSCSGFSAVLEGQSSGSSTWGTSNLTGWRELDSIPLRVNLCGSPNTTETITINVDHMTPGARSYYGIQNLTGFTASENVVLSELMLSDLGNIWAYSFKVRLMNDQPGFVEFRGRLAAGAHYFTGSSLNLRSSSLGNLAIIKPAAVPGSPDLSITKSGPLTAKPDSTITYSLSYQNKDTTTASAATGVQVTDVLPGDSVSYVPGSCVPACTFDGNTLTWDFESLERTANGTVSYQVTVKPSAAGKSFTNIARISSAEDDANESDNESRLMTTGEAIPTSSLPADQDDDGLPDTWEVDNGLSPLVPADATGDLDNDGLTNTQEFEFRTNPRNSDSDNDGLPDKWEVDHGLNPLNPTDATGDLDNDGLTNTQEFELRTNPQHRDSDNDGLPDKWEVDHGLNPRDGTGANGATGDPDKDGLTNTQEFELNTNPTNSDTDGDGLPNGWEIQYGLDPNSSVDGDGAEGDPDKDGLTNKREYELGTNPTNSDTDGDGLPNGWEIQYGLDQASKEGVNGADGDRDEDGLTNKREFELGTNPASKDSDGDGLPDKWEVDHGLNPLNPADAAGDPDKDGLTNTQEFERGTNPQNPDSDGDGLPDGWEVQYGLNPTNGQGNDGATGDPDGDGATNTEELTSGTNPSIPVAPVTSGTNPSIPVAPVTSGTNPSIPGAPVTQNPAQPAPVTETAPGIKPPAQKKIYLPVVSR